MCHGSLAIGNAKTLPTRSECIMSKRLNYFLGFLLIFTLVLFSFYLQIYDGVIPCPLCTLQRLAFISLGFIFLCGIFSSSWPWARLLTSLFAIVVAIIGIFLSGRQIWLQHYPSGESDACGVSLEYMLQVLPLNEVFQKILVGSSECSQRGWEFLNLNVAEWSFLWFLLFLGWSVYLFLSDIRPR